MLRQGHGLPAVWEEKIALTSRNVELNFSAPVLCLDRLDLEGREARVPQTVQRQVKDCNQTPPTED